MVPEPPLPAGMWLMAVAFRARLDHKTAVIGLTIQRPQQG